MRRIAQCGRAFLAASHHGTPCAPSQVFSGRATSLRRGATTATTPSPPAASTEGTGSTGWTPFAAVMFIPSAICGCLAYWQYERMQWKADLIRAREGISASDPRDLFSLDEPREYDKVSVRGRFLHEYSLYVGPRPRSVPGYGILPGYLVITPLVAEDRKGVVLVNRGWVPSLWKDDAQAAAAETIRQRESKGAAEPASPPAAPPTASAAAPAGPSGWRRWFGGGKPSQSSDGSGSSPETAAAAVAVPPKPEAEVVIGVIQADEQANQFMPANRPDSEEFHYVQRDAMTSALGLPPSTPLIMAISTDPATAVPTHKQSPLQNARGAPLAAERPAPGAAAPGAAAEPGARLFPQPKNVGDLVRFATMPSDHLNYALIWASLCVVLAGMARTAVTKPLRGPRIVDHGPGAREAWKASQAS